MTIALLAVCNNPVQAGGSYTIRKNCTWYSHKYVANAHISYWRSWFFSIAVAREANCSGASALATHPSCTSQYAHAWANSGGGGIKINTWSPCSGGTANRTLGDAGLSNIKMRSTFDTINHRIVLDSIGGYCKTKGNYMTRMRIVVWKAQDDAVNGVQDTVLTPAKILFESNFNTQNGNMIGLNGFTANSFVRTTSQDTAVFTFNNLNQTFTIPATINLDDVAISVISDTYAPETLSTTPVIIGTATTANTSSAYPAPFQDFYKNSKQYILIKASELNAQGINGAGNFTQIGFNITALNTVGLMENYTISMKNTAAAALTTTADNLGFTQVYNPTNLTLTATGIYYFTLNTPFYWDGSSNLLIQICEGAITGAFTNNASTTYSAAGFNAYAHYKSDGTAACPIATGLTTATNRPNTYLTFTSTAAACSGTPTLGNTIASSTAICSGSVANLSLQSTPMSSGISYQWQSSPIGSGTWTNIAGATSVTYSPTVTVPAEYKCVAMCASSGLSGTSTPVTVTLNPFTQCYCASGATSTADEDILSVSFNGNTNTSTCATTATGSGSVLNLYSNYTTLSGTAPNYVYTGSFAATQGTSVPFSVQIGTCGGNFSNSIAIWIDFNQNGVFDTNEKVYNSAVATNGPHTENGSISVPATATLGLTRMRILNSEGNVPTNPCGTYAWGETEDYLVNITAAPLCNISLTVTSTQNVLCNGGNTGSINVNITGGQGPYGTAAMMNGCLLMHIGCTLNGGTFSQNNGICTCTHPASLSPTGTFASLEAGIYTISVTDANGCTATSSTTVTEPTALTLTATSSTNIITANAAGGTPSYTYAVNGATQLSANTFQVANSGTYIVNATDANGCTTSIAVQPCVNTVNTTSMTACDSYMWAVNGMTYTTSGTYTAIFVDAQGCTHTEVLYLTIYNSTPHSTSAIACDSYTWAVNGTTYTTSGTYTANLTNPMGCMSTETLILTINNSTTSSANATACDSYTWAANGTTYTASGTYVATSTNAVGCTHTETLNLIINTSLPSVSATATPTILTCSTPSSTLTATAGSATYAWSNGGTGSTATVTTADIYTVTATSNNGCTSTASITITANMSPPPSIALTAIADLDNMTFSVTGSDFTNTNYANVFYINGITATPIPGSLSPTSATFNAPLGYCDSLYTIAFVQSPITATPNTSCYTTSTTAVTANFWRRHFYATQNCGIVTVTRFHGFLLPHNFNWTMRPCNAATPAYSGSSTTGQPICPTAFAPGCYTLCISQLNSPSACSDYCLQITIAPRPSVTLTGNSTVCSNSTTQICAVGTSGVTPYTYLWTYVPPSGLGIGLAATTACINASAGTYTVTITDANGCTATASKVITVLPSPTVTITANAPIGTGGTVMVCAGQTLVLTATGGGTYAWSKMGSAAIIGASATYSYTEMGASLYSTIYTVTVTNANGCTATKQIGVSFNLPIPIANITVTGNTCPKTLTASGGGTYLWNTSATTASISAASSGTYTVTVTNTAGCTATKTVTVDCCNLQITEMRHIVYIHAQAVTFPAPTVTGCAAGSVLSYLWEFGDGTTSTLSNPTRTYTSTGVFNVCLTVTCTAANGTYCRAKCCREVNIGKNCSVTYPTFGIIMPATSLVYAFTGTTQSATVTASSNSTYEVFNSTNALVSTVQGINANYTFTTNGEYTVCRTVTTVADATFGGYCSNKNCRKITVMPITGCNASAKFTATTYKSNLLNVSFNGSSYSTGALTYYWEYSTSPVGTFTQLGTAANAALGTPSFVFPSLGIYWVRLTINKGTVCETTAMARLSFNSITCSASSNYNPTVGTGGTPPVNRGSNPDGSIEIANSDINDGIALYPNPTDGNVIIAFGNDIKGTTMIKVFDMKGQLVNSFRTQDGDNQTVVDLTEQAAGVYLFHIENESGERLVKKVVKQ
ncbi:MAG: hypothetical protein RI894_1618 [Bacteroidota bacterium]